MSEDIKIFDKSIPEINFFSRQKKHGQELEMVEQFIEHIIRTNHKTKTKLAIFCEPQLEFGYPDIVIVEYDDYSKIEWNRAREELDNSDLKILCEVNRAGKTTVSSMAWILGYTEKEMEKHLVKLKEAHLIKMQGEIIHKKSENSYNCIKKIIAIEAKIDKWNNVINQACNSYIFASEVYVLLNKKSCTEKMESKCADDGLGIILVNDKIKKVQKAQRNPYQESYISLLFNEWIHRIEKRSNQ